MVCRARKVRLAVMVVRVHRVRRGKTEVKAHRGLVSRELPANRDHKAT